MIVAQMAIYAIEKMREHRMGMFASTKEGTNEMGHRRPLRPWVREHDDRPFEGVWHRALGDDSDRHLPMICGKVIAGSPTVAEELPKSSGHTVCPECARIIETNAEPTPYKNHQIKDLLMLVGLHINDQDHAAVAAENELRRRFVAHEEAVKALHAFYFSFPREHLIQVAPRITERLDELIKALDQEVLSRGT